MSDDTLFELADDGSGADAGPATLTVTELAGRIARVTADAFPDDLWVAGQIRNLSRSANGHVYFNLAEPVEVPGQQPAAQISVTLLAPEKRLVNDQLRRAGGAVRMEDGIEVRIQARLRWWAPRGTLQLRMHGIDPEFTIGRLQADRDRILATLAAEGLLEANGRRPLPAVPLRIGLITSVGSAAHADVLAELTGSGIGFTIRQVDARTQGVDSVPSIMRGLDRLTRDDVDVVLLVRGGGARTDLVGFDAEPLARAIAAMPVPVLTGIGHEIDRAVADEVAHTSFKTPTAAAASLVQRIRAYLEQLDIAWADARRAARASAQIASARLDTRAIRIGQATARVLDRAERDLDRRRDELGVRAQRTLARTDRSLDGLAARVSAHDPALLLRRGWTITTDHLGHPVRSVADLTPGATLHTRFADGTVTATVTDIAPATQEPPA